jgi:dipeptidyl aminopeptidase/acylaminoacyl peptidase
MGRLIAALCALSFSTLSTFAASTFTVDDLLHVANASIADITEDGRYVAMTVASLEDRIGIDNHRFGDPTYIAPQKMDLFVIETQTGTRTKVFADRVQVRVPKWSPDGSRLALLVLRDGKLQPAIWTRATAKLQWLTPANGGEADESSEITWSRDGARVMLMVHPAGWTERARARFRAETSAPIVFHSTKEPFLAWIDVRRMSLERSVQVFDAATGAAREIVPLSSTRTSARFSEDGAFAILQDEIVKKTDYDTLGTGESRIDYLKLDGSKPRTIVASTKGMNIIWSRDLHTYAYAKDGAVYVANVEDKEARLIAGKKKDDSKPAEKTDEKPGDKKETFSAVRLSPRGDRIVLSNKEGLWLADTATGSKDLFLKMPEDDKESPRYTVQEFSPAGDAVFLNYSARTKWDRGEARYDIAVKKLDLLVHDTRIYQTPHLSRDGSRWVYVAAGGNRPGEVFTADASFRGERKLTDINPQLADKALAKTELSSYLDADGKKEFGVLYYPANYEPGKKYPTVFNIYEQYFDDTFVGTLNILAANGYAVVQPSVEFETGFPGEAWEKGVTAAANRVIEMGVADPDRLGVQGQSYGGYATNLLITQTHRFKAAINISGKVNMISFYTDSPRLGVRNIHAPEKSQDRLGATLWQQPQKYIQHSAIMFADRIQTPLLLTTGDQDHNVPGRQAMEMYYALRRLGKEVAWVNYTNGGHGMPTSTVEEVRDFHQRIVAWYDDHLKKDTKTNPESGAGSPNQ